MPLTDTAIRNAKAGDKLRKLSDGHGNEIRPHSAIGNKPPISLMNGSPAPLPA